jgi:hypothetical protein
MKKSCQKKAQLTTGLGSNEEKLSKGSQTYDRFGIRRRKAVRRKPNFRQVWDQMKKSCQKKAQLTTGLGSNEEKLSKESSTCDRFGIK